MRIWDTILLIENKISINLVGSMPQIRVKINL
jgi:hypothetical protein